MTGAVEPQRRGRTRRGALVRLWAGAFFLLLCLAHGNLETPDSAFTMNAARALWLRGDAGLLRAEDGGGWLAERLAAGWIAQHGGASYGRTGLDGRHQYVWFPHGHVWLMVPAVAVGEVLARWFPAAEERYRARCPEPDGRVYAEGQLVWHQGAAALLLPAAAGATTLLLLFLLARALGGTDREALLSASVTGFATQCFPLFRETLSDGPGLALLLAALLVAVRAFEGAAGPRLLLLGGLAAGAAVLVRYQHAFPVLALALAVALAARRQRRWSLLGMLALGGLPAAVALFGTNWLRFGDPLDTGYPPFATWFDYPPWLGLPKLLFAAGKGILWFSPLLWLALPLAARRANVPVLRWLCWTLLLIPLLLFSATSGWQSGQCWGARYVTPGVVAFLALLLPQARPWRRWPRTFGALVGLGLLVNVTSLLAPTHGHNQLAGQAVRALYAQAVARGELSQAEFAALDEADHYFFLPRFSPLHAHWTYAAQALTGAFEDEAGRPRVGSQHTIGPLFGVHSEDPGHTLAPIHWEDRGFRHLWFRFWGELLGVPWWLLLLPPLAAGTALLRAGWRRLSRD